jgi:N-acyl-D-aspartate/D-glutamate deacylase
MLARFRDPDLRRQIIEEAEQAMNLRFGGPEGVLLLSANLELTAAIEEMKLDSPGEAVIRLLEESEHTIIARFGAESDLVEIMRHPTASISCDCGASTSERVHPRYYGTFPKVLGEYVREKAVMTLENAIYKMSGLPAKTIGLVDRGLIKPGMAADITVFNPRTITDRATYEEPTALSEGISYTIVNGQLAWDRGQATRLQAGRTIRRRSIN